MPGFDEAVAFTLRAEGGFTKADGHATNMGITQETYDAYLQSKNSACASVESIDQDTATKIYREWYWEPTGCDGMPYPVAVCVFDFAVNAGGDRAIRFLQKALWVAEDGIIGKETAQAARFCDAPQVAYAYLTLRRQYYARLPDARFMRGWLGRCDSLWKHILEVRDEEDQNVVQA